MKYNEDFYIRNHISENNKNANDFLVKVKGATYKENPRLFILKDNENFDFALFDKETGKYVVRGKTLKELDKKYNAKAEMYNKVICSDTYKRFIKEFRQLQKERLIATLRGQER